MWLRTVLLLTDSRAAMVVLARPWATTSSTWRSAQSVAGRPAAGGWKRPGIHLTYTDQGVHFDGLDSPEDAKKAPENFSANSAPTFPPAAHEDIHCHRGARLSRIASCHVTAGARAVQVAPLSRMARGGTS